MEKCPYCERPLAGDICLLHGYVGKKADSTTGQVPVGGIILWSGTATAVPQSWALCDGTGGTPDLRSKFVMGAGTVAAGTTGGTNAAHAHSVPSLTASTSGTSGAGSAHAHSVSVSAHPDLNTGTHVGHGVITTGTPSATQEKNEGAGAAMTVPTPGHTHSFTDYDHTHLIATITHSASSGNESAHTHSLSTSGSTGTGTSGTAGSMPAYYALAYIMRVK
jgi:hypothetical protein